MENENEMEEPREETMESVDERNDEEEKPEVEETMSLSRTEFDRMLTEAEERGYLRGKNEKIVTVMHKPNLLTQQPFVENEDNLGQLMILRELRRTCWN